MLTTVASQAAADMKGHGGFVTRVVVVVVMLMLVVVEGAHHTLL